MVGLTNLFILIVKPSSCSSSYKVSKVACVWDLVTYIINVVGNLMTIVAHYEPDSITEALKDGRSMT